MMKSPVVRESIHFGLGRLELLAEAEPAGEPAKPRKFETTAYQGGPLLLNGWDLPVVVDLSGLEVGKSITANLHHNDEKIVGHVTSVTNNGRTLSLKGVVSGAGAAAAEFLDATANGYPWQASIEAKPLQVSELPDGQSAIVNGQTVRGPALIVRKSKLYGVAFLPRGADENTSVALAAGAISPMPKWNVGDRVRVAVDSPHMAGQSEGTVALVTTEPTYGVVFDGMEDMGIHRWYVESELAAAEGGAPEGGAAKEQSQSMAASAARKAGTMFDLKAVEAGCTAHSNNLERLFALHEREIRDRQRLGTIKASAEQAARELRTRALDQRWDEKTLDVEMVKAAARVELELVRAALPKGPGVHSSTRDATPDVIEAALCLNAGLPAEFAAKHFNEQVVDAAMQREFRGMGLHRLIVAAASENGYQCRPGEGVTAGNLRELLRYAFPPTIHASGFSTISLPGVLSNAQGKHLLNAFASLPSVVPLICRTEEAMNFKVQARYRLVGSGQFEPVAPGGEIKHISLQESSYTQQVGTVGATLVLTREALINDDLGAFANVPRVLGRGAAIKRERALFELLLANPGNFFSTTNGNFLAGAGTALSLAALQQAEQVFLELTDANGDPIMSVPRTLLVPAALSSTAFSLVSSTNLNQVPASNAAAPAGNPYANRFTPLPSPWLGNEKIVGSSDLAWYLFSDPADIAAVEVAYLGGSQTPIIEQAEVDFSTLGIGFRCYYDFGFALGEPAGAVKMKGEV